MSGLSGTGAGEERETTTEGSPVGGSGEAPCEICGIRRLAGFNAPALKRMHAEEGHGVPEAIRAPIRVIRLASYSVGWVQGGLLERAAENIIVAYIALADQPSVSESTP